LRIQQNPNAIAVSLKRTVSHLARRLGYQIVSSDALEDRAFALHLEQLFRQLDVQCVLDVGANSGQYRKFLRDVVGYQGLIISFEPQPLNVARLREQAKTDPQWIIQDYALGSEDARRSFNVMKLDLLSSFREPDSSAVPMLRDFNVVDYRQDVEIRRLDSVIDGLRSRHTLRNLYLKLDTQGFDLEVIRGAPATLPAVRALQTELSMQPIYKNAPPFRVMLEALTEHNFAVTGMFPVVRDQKLRVVEFDCVLINSDEASLP
jgi:FkbM family methyltransferase